ncbi:MAG: pyridoxine 5'-phosphate synthase [Gemmatimonadetes bacterium]|nr:pyridoxine 5'-phosphate synthase [Gemmatimonadota bacterium]MBT8403404.1 pyridoxine 5'-phosphate synthase [Gemmatimonadota bacterium]
MRFYVNIDHVATVRQARRTDEPDPVRAAVLAELGGADGITVHLREDRRHIQERDVRLLAETLRTPMNLELAMVPEIVDLACELRPYQVTVVPERRQEVTTEGGLDVVTDASRSRLEPVLVRLRDAGIRTALFIDPDPDALQASAALGVEAVELHTGEYALAHGAQVHAELDRLADAAAQGRRLGLAVHAGHGLTYENVTPVAALRDVEELNIGHSVISRAVLVGLREAVTDMATVLRRAAGGDA